MKIEKVGAKNPAERRAANCLRKSLATNFFGPFPQEIARHKLFRLISSENRPPQNFFSQLPEEIARKRPVRRPAKLAGYGMYPKCDGENFAGDRSPSFLLLIEEKKQKKIKAGAPAGEICR
ncbi:hypothetical protein T231_15690 [Tannerella sp. oral taxon BU063 isolate Cell 6/7/9]|uniref:Uncharacterized protein n=1 Tax=Tannerella sp. oral taxon BU063 isolate Cell 6/7/9 TaxID=1411021 RepID=W2CMM7_9BACT|nr:hypothetical protein T231_15690 [Tannerella sp. oral taxon BU063 isolate Cell 6/7/9]